MCARRHIYVIFPVIFVCILKVFSDHIYMFDCFALTVTEMVEIFQCYCISNQAYIKILKRGSVVLTVDV